MATIEELKELLNMIDDIKDIRSEEHTSELQSLS